MNEKMIKIRLAEDDDQERWDEFVLRHPEASPYHLFAWKKAIGTAYRHRCNYFYVEKNNEILGVMPLVCLHLPAIVNEVIGLPYCDVGNCIATSEEAQDLLISKAIQYSEKIKAKKLEIRGDLIQTEIVRSRFETKETGKVRMFLDLLPSSDDLFDSFKSKLRSQVRKAEKNGVSFHWGSLEDIDKAYHVFSKNMHELGSPVHSKYFLKAVLSHYGERSRLGIAEYQGKTIGMGIILCCGRSIAIPWASTLRDYNRLGPNMLLYWNFLKYSADNGYRHFDFGRSSVGEGTYKFKQQWGAKQKTLIWFNISKECDNVKESPENLNKRDIASVFWQKLPLTVANIIGPHLRKYISL